jgi:hypothetical protein
MNFIEAFTEVRRRMGFIGFSKSDTEWLCRKIVNDNRKVFDALA